MGALPARGIHSSGDHAGPAIEGAGGERPLADEGVDAPIGNIGGGPGLAGSPRRRRTGLQPRASALRAFGAGDVAGGPSGAPSGLGGGLGLRAERLEGCVVVLHPQNPAYPFLPRQVREQPNAARAVPFVFRKWGKRQKMGRG